MNEYANRTINLAFSAVPLSSAEKAFILSGYNDENKQEIIRIATKKKVLPVVGKMLASLQIDKDFWTEKYNFFLQRNLKVTELIADVFKRFHENRIDRVCAFENYGAMLAAESDIALYSSGDVDLYADVIQKQEIENVMASFGYYPTLDDCHRHNINTEFLKENGIIRINVAWKPLRRYLLPISFDAAKYFKWGDMKCYKDTDIRVPSPETLLYMCFLRIAVHGYSRSPDIRLYIDTINSSRNNPDWKTVMDWAEADKVKTKFIAVATIANDLVKLPVPNYVLNEAKKDRFTQHILTETYDFEKHTLIYDPSGLKLLRVEAASDQSSVVREIMCMAFPPRKWLCEYYHDDGSAWYKKYINYYKRLI